MSDIEGSYEYVGEPLAHGLSADDPIPDALRQQLERADSEAVYNYMTIDETNVYLFGRRYSEDGQSTAAAYAAHALLFDEPHGWSVRWRGQALPC